MNIHIQQIYEFVLKKKVPVNELVVYVAAAGVHDEIEWDNDEGWSLKYDESYRYKRLDYFLNEFLQHKWSKKR